MSVDCERWLDELTHKYLDYIQRRALLRLDHDTDVEEEFNELVGPKITPERLEHFSAILRLAIQDLVDFIDQSK